MNLQTKHQTKTKILLVEDEALIALSQKIILESLDFGVTVVNSGEKALEYIKTNETPDIVLMDIDLGEGMDGVQASQSILNILEIPIIFVTSRSEPEFLEATEKVSSYGYLAKMNNANIFHASIKVALKLFAAKKAMELKEAELIRSQERYKALVEWSPNPICIHRDGKIIFSNPSLHKLLKAKNSTELEGRSIIDFIHADFQEVIQSRIDSMDSEHKEVEPKKEIFICLDGTLVNVLVRGIKVFFDGSPSILAYINEL
ncbi:MAG: response regulator [Leptospira sp.]|nr:response regulator [Leptospira sp.]